MNKASLTPAIVRMLTLSTIPLLTYFGVTQYNELNKVELPELPIIEEVEPEVQLPTAPQQPVQKRTRKVWKQTEGKSFNSWFSSSYTTYNYSDKALASWCKGQLISIYKNWCNQAKFQEVEEEIPQ